MHSIHLAFGLRKGKAAEEPAPAPAKNGKGKGKAEEPKETGATTSAAILDSNLCWISVWVGSTLHAGMVNGGN